MTIQEIKSKINKDIKIYRTKEKIAKDEEYKLSYSMIADYLEELKEEI